MNNYLVVCKACGELTERSKNRKNARCFDCKKKMHKQRNDAKKIKNI